jgi:hypothetical protein
VDRVLRLRRVADLLRLVAAHDVSGVVGTRRARRHGEAPRIGFMATEAPRRCILGREALNPTPSADGHE